MTQEQGLLRWPSCPEKNSPSGQGWGLDGLRRPQQSTREDSSVECHGGPWARSLDLGHGEAGLKGWVGGRAGPPGVDGGRGRPEGSATGGKQ